MATTSSPTPILFSVLTSSHDNNDDFVNQLRNHLTQIETNIQQTLNKIQQRRPYSSLSTNTNQIDPQIRNQFFDVLKNVAIKNNLAFNEPFFRQQFLEKRDSSSSPKIDVLRDKPSITTDNNVQHLSPVNNTRRSQFAPVLSSTPVHQTNPIIPIPVDLSLATPSVAPVLTINSTHLPAVPPSAIVPQRANLARTAGRPPRIPRGESVTRQKKNPSPIKEQQEEILLAKEIHITSKRRIKSKQEIVEDNVEVIIEQNNEILPDIIKQVQSTPLRGRKKKIIQEDINHIPQLEPPPLTIIENEILPKTTRGGRSKTKKDEEVAKPTRTASVRNRKKKQDEDFILPAPKKTTRNKKLVEPVVNTEENPPPVMKVRATPSRDKKKSPVEIAEPIIPSTPEKAIGNKKLVEPVVNTEENPPVMKVRATPSRDKKKSPVEIAEPIIPPAPKKTTRNKKLVEPVVNIEENPPPVMKVRATPSRDKKKSPVEIAEPIIPSTPKKTTTKSKKRKGNEDTNENPIDTIQPPSPKRRGGRNTKSKNSSPVETIPTPPLIEQEPQQQQQQPVSTRTSRRGKKDIDIPIEKQEDIVLNKKNRTGRGKKNTQPINTDNSITVTDVVMASVTVSAPIPKSLSMNSLVTKPPRPPVARKKKSIAMPPIPQMSPSTPPPTQRIQSTSPVNDKALLPLPIPTSASRHRQQQQRPIPSSPKRGEEGTLETLPSITRNQKRTSSSIITTPKRIRRDDLILTAIPGTPGKKRNKCTCQKRRNRICDICAAAIDV